MRVVFNAYPADLHDTVAVSANREVNSVRLTILRKVRAGGGVPEIAALPEFLVGWCHALVSRSGAMAVKAIAEGKAAPMRP